MGRKIATCCYCGTRAVMIFDQGLHELTCGACGAPLHKMKMMPQTSDNKFKMPVERTGRKEAKRRESLSSADRRDWSDREGRKRRRKRRKPIVGRVLEELWDVVEDIFD